MDDKRECVLIAVVGASANMENEGVLAGNAVVVAFVNTRN